MKRIFIFLLLSLFLSNCDDYVEQKENDSEIIHLLNDTIIQPNIYIDPATNKGYYELDIDNDKIVDIIFAVERYSLGRGSRDRSYIALKNDFSIAYQNSYEITTGTNVYNPDYKEVDSLLVQIPKILSPTDTISNKLLFTNDLITLALRGHDSYMGHSSNSIIGTWVGAGEGYIGLYNEPNNIYCWIKINVIEYNKIMLKSFKYSINREILVIE